MEQSPYVRRAASLHRSTGSTARFRVVHSRPANLTRRVAFADVDEVRRSPSLALPAHWSDVVRVRPAAVPGVSTLVR